MVQNKLKTVFVRKTGGEGGTDEEHEFVDPPYTMFGSPHIPESQSIIMKVGGLKEMLKDLNDDDSFRIEWFAGNRATKYSFFKKAK